MFKKVMTLGIFVIMLFSSLVGFSACEPPEKDGFEFGFIQYRTNTGGMIKTAIRGEKNEFEINDVTFELYFGLHHGRSRNKISDLIFDSVELELISIAVLFVRIGGSTIEYFQNWNSYRVGYDDYRNIGHDLIREIPIGEFESEAYDVKLTTRGLFNRPHRWEFTHSESLTVPQEYLLTQAKNGTKGRISLLVAPIILDKQTNKYFFLGASEPRGTCFELLDNGKVRLPCRSIDHFYCV